MMDLLESMFNIVIPLLFLAVIWFYLMRCFSGGKSPMIQLMERQVDLMERQIGLIERQNDLAECHVKAVERIALALETRNEAV